MQNLIQEAKTGRSFYCRDSIEYKNYKTFTCIPKIKLCELGDFEIGLFEFHNRNKTGHFVKTSIILSKIEIFQYEFDTNYALCSIEISRAGQYVAYEKYCQTQFRLSFMELEDVFNLPFNMFEQYKNKKSDSFKFSDYSLLIKLIYLSF